MHLATNTYEIGNPDLTPETAHAVDLTLRKHAGRFQFVVSVFHSQVNQYIYGRTLDQEGAFRLMDYDQRDARFTGLEASVSYRFTPSVSATVFGDYVRAQFAGGGNLPRIPAGRAGVRLQTQLDSDQPESGNARSGLYGHALHQSKLVGVTIVVPALDDAVAAHSINPMPNQIDGVV